MRRLNQESITLKAFANSSPGLRFGNPGKGFIEDATLKELGGRLLTPKVRNAFRVANNFLEHYWTQGFKAKP